MEERAARVRRQREGGKAMLEAICTYRGQLGGVVMMYAPAHRGGWANAVADAAAKAGLTSERGDITTHGWTGGKEWRAEGKRDGMQRRRRRRRRVARADARRHGKAGRKDTMPTRGGNSAGREKVHSTKYRGTAERERSTAPEVVRWGTGVGPVWGCCRTTITITSVLRHG